MYMASVFPRAVTSAAVAMLSRSFCTSSSWSSSPTEREKHLHAASTIGR